VAVRRGVVLVLVLVGIAVMFSITCLVVLFALLSRGPSVPRSAALELQPGGSLAEVAGDDLLQVFGGRQNTVRGFVETLRAAKRDPRIKSVVLRPSALELPFWGKLQELRDAVTDFRASGKAVIAFLESGGDREYYLASAANRVYLLPTSQLDLTGVASYELFLRGTLDKVGVHADFIAVGEYKSAPNQLTETGFTPAHREMAESLNREMYDQLVRGIAEARRKTEPEVRALLDDGPFLAEAAVRAGLVDDLAYDDQLDDKASELRQDGRELKRIDGADYGRGARGSLRGRGGKVAVIYAVGTIVSGASVYDPLNGALLGSDTLVEEIRRVRDDRSVDAVVLRIDSPGGSSTASDVIWRELMITRQQNPSRPLVVSMSDLAASGGYYIAMPGQMIVAQPGTLTGSIGVYGGKMVLQGTMEKIGAGTATVKDGANADIYSPFSRFSDPQRQRLQNYMDAFYRTFVQRVADGRKKTFAEIDAVARGRVWTGRQARDRGLVDRLGGLDTAIAAAKELAGIPANQDVDVVSYPSRRTIYDLLTQQFGGSGTSLFGALAGRSDARAIMAATASSRLFRRGEPLALMPFSFVR
jgi:protease IV